MKKVFDQMLCEADSVCIIGHTNPDGDCIGSTLGLYNYIHAKFPGKKAVVYLEEPSSKFSYLNGFREIVSENCIEKKYGLCVVCDCAETKRIGKFLKYLSMAEKSFLIDHHITNQGFGDQSVIIPEASSTSEILFDLMDESFLDRKIAECIYTGIIHDTGVFKYNCTDRHTMDVAGKCMDAGIGFGLIIDKSFFSMDLKAKRLLGRVLSDLRTEEDGKLVYAVLDRKTMLEAGIENARDTDGFIDNIRTTDGAVAAAFFYQITDGNYKASLRSSVEGLNVAEIAMLHGGGGHAMAAGCTLSGDVQKMIRQVIEELQEQIRKL